MFWRTSETARTKHFSRQKKYPRSITDAWTNTVTNVLPSKEKLTADDGTVVEVKLRTDDVADLILGQWCKPTGLCYNPFAGSMGLGMACFDLGIQYIAVEETETCFTAAGERLIDRLRERQNKKGAKRRFRTHRSLCLKTNQLTLHVKACAVLARIFAKSTDQR